MSEPLPTAAENNKKFYAPTFAMNGHDVPVNFDHVHSVEMVDDMGLKERDGRYKIHVYSSNPLHRAHIVIWRFVEKTGDHGRDAAFERLKNIITNFV